MKSLLFAAAFILVLQDDDKAVADLVAKLPDAKASEQLVKLGDKAVPALLKAFVREAPWEERKISIETALWKIRGFRVSRAWTPDVLVDQMTERHVVARCADDAAKVLKNLDKAFPGLDWSKEMVLVVFPAQKLQEIVVTAVVADEKAKTLTVKYDAVNRGGCGNTMRCETARAIAVKNVDFKIVYEPTVKQE